MKLYFIRLIHQANETKYRLFAHNSLLYRALVVFVVKMKKPKLLEIVLTDPRTVYFPGHVVHGNLQVEVTEDQTVRDIQVKCRGRGHVYWATGSGKYRRTYSSTDEYVNAVLTVFGNTENTGLEETLTTGTHTFPFQFELPLDIPGSFESGANSYVRYWLKAIINWPKQFDKKKKYKLLFTVGATLDLNTVPNASDPVQDTRMKTLCCLCCETPPISALFRLDKTGYVPGEDIICHAEINEDSGKGVHASTITLVMIITYRTHGGSTHHVRRNISFLRHGAISPGESDSWRGERIRVPPLPPSYLPHCNLIGINYLVKLSVDVLSAAVDLKILLPIVIGTIPLQSTVNHYMLMQNSCAITHQPKGLQASVNDDFLPSYAECALFRATFPDDDHFSLGNVTFSPSYTYYKWATPSTVDDQKI